MERQQTVIHPFDFRVPNALGSTTTISFISDLGQKQAYYGESIIKMKLQLSSDQYKMVPFAEGTQVALTPFFEGAFIDCFELKWGKETELDYISGYMSKGNFVKAILQDKKPLSFEERITQTDGGKELIVEIPLRDLSDFAKGWDGAMTGDRCVLHLYPCDQNRVIESRGDVAPAFVYISDIEWIVPFAEGRLPEVELIYDWSCSNTQLLYGLTKGVEKFIESFNTFAQHKCDRIIISFVPYTCINNQKQNEMQSVLPSEDIVAELVYAGDTYLPVIYNNVLIFDVSEADKVTMSELRLTLPCALEENYAVYATSMNVKTGQMSVKDGKTMYKKL